MLKTWLTSYTKRHKAKKLKSAADHCAVNGLTVCTIINRAGTDYILAVDGSWRRIGNKAEKVAQG